MLEEATFWSIWVYQENFQNKLYKDKVLASIHTAIGSQTGQPALTTLKGKLYHLSLVAGQ